MDGMGLLVGGKKLFFSLAKSPSCGIYHENLKGRPDMPTALPALSLGCLEGLVFFWVHIPPSGYPTRNKTT